MQTVSFTVNGKQVHVECYPAIPLLDVLREDLYLTGSKECCGKGECGSCTVLLDDELVCSCLVLAGQVEGKTILTVEGIGSIEQMDPLQDEFVTRGATQCGYCTPGFIAAAWSFLQRLEHEPSQEEVQSALAGNLCRCTGYTKIIEAVMACAQKKQ